MDTLKKDYNTKNWSQSTQSAHLYVPNICHKPGPYYQEVAVKQVVPNAAVPHVNERWVILDRIPIFHNSAQQKYMSVYV